MWPQIAYISLCMVGFGITVAKHGESQTPHSIWSHLFAILLVWPLLYFGGFFAPLGFHP